jgi:hypothetical protein
MIVSVDHFLVLKDNAVNCARGARSSTDTNTEGRIADSESAKRHAVFSISDSRLRDSMLEVVVQCAAKVAFACVSDIFITREILARVKATMRLSTLCQTKILPVLLNVCHRTVVDVRIGGRIKRGVEYGWIKNVEIVQSEWAAQGVDEESKRAEQDYQI